MPRRPKPTPYDLTVRLIEIDWDPSLADHIVIEVDATYTYPEDGPHTLTDTIAGYRWCASMFARLATRVAEDVYEHRRNHGWCTGPVHCGIDLVESSPIWRHAPTMTINLPTGMAEDYVAEWLTRVNTILSDIVTADQWQPSEADEAAWG